MIFVRYLMISAISLWREIAKSCGTVTESEQVKNIPFERVDGFRSFSFIYVSFLFYPEQSLSNETEIKIQLSAKKKKNQNLG